MIGAIGGATSALVTPYIGAAVVGNDGAASSGQGAVIAGLSTLVSGAVAGALGQNVAGAATAAENESLNNCNLHECWKKVVDAWNSANNTAKSAFDQLAFHMPDGVAQGLVAGANVPAMESATNLDLLKGVGNVVFNLPSFSVPGMPDYTPVFQYNNPLVGGIGEMYGLGGLSELATSGLPGVASESGPSIQFGANDNQSYHTFRHIVGGGYDPTAVQSAVTSDLKSIGSSLQQGQYTGTVVVDGTTFKYSAYKLPDGTINVGRITPPR